MKRWTAFGRGFLVLAVGLVLTSSATGSPTRGSVQHRVSFDSYSFIIDGQRTYIWSGEFHPYRLPSPQLWPDIFQKMKAAGFNTASIYFSWGYHSSKEGVYDFTGVRNLDRLLDDARDAGIYVIARPGPYINAEVDSGGFPLWLTTKGIRNRSDDPQYLKYADEWMTQIDRILARHQITDGKGSVIAYQVENEYYNGSTEGRAYMQHLEEKARTDGIMVPLVGNHNDTFVTGKGAVEVSGWDYYPQGFDCSHPEHWAPAPDMAAHRHPGQPLFTAEFQGGAFDPWGGPGYSKCAQLINDQFADVFYKENIAAGATAQNFYMLFGGTSWGWQAIPENYSSYDYGAAITEARQFDPKYYEDKRIGYFVTGTSALLKTDELSPAQLDSSELIDRARINPDTGTQFHLLRHRDTTATSLATTHIALDLQEGQFDAVPQEPGTAITINGRESKILLADYDLGRTRMVYSTSELMRSGAIGGQDIAVLYGDRGTAGETVLAFARRPSVQVLSGTVTTTWSKGMLRLNYSHNGLLKVRITGGERPLLLILADKQATERVWQTESAAGPVLLIGSHLLRSARVVGRALALTGDSGTASTAILYAAPSQSVTWNGRPLVTRRDASDGVRLELPAPTTVHLPRLDKWYSRKGAPEIARTFDDTSWTVADRMTSNSITKPGSFPVLFADDYGFHTGNTWYRGHFTIDGQHPGPSGIALSALSGGRAGIFSVWLNGHFLGSEASGSDGEEHGSFSFQSDMLVQGDNVISVLTINMGHEEDYNAKGENRTARGLIGAIMKGAPTDEVRWRVQGEGGKTGAPDSRRGPYNLGGLYGERMGWTDVASNSGWSSARLPASDHDAGVTWYRSVVSLDLPKGQDTSVGILITDPPERHYRALIFVNGWQMGNYISDLGPQHSFPIPNGVLKPDGENTICIAVWKTDQNNGGLGRVSLVNYGNHVSTPRRTKRNFKS